MLTSKEKGDFFEDTVLQFLKSKLYTFQERNYRYRKGEVDLIVKSPKGCLVFVEVKYRSGGKYGNPEEFVSNEQFLRIQNVAEYYIHLNDWNGPIRFDVVSCLGQVITHFIDIDI